MGLVERALTGGHGNTSAELQRVLRQDPNDTRALLRFAELEAKGGRAASACEGYSRAGDLFVRQGFARRALAAFAQALAVARDGALADRVQPIAHAMGKLYVGEKLVRDAVTTLDGAARWLIERGFDANALPLLHERLAIEESDVARVRLAETYFRLGDPQKAADLLVTSFRRLHAQGRRDEALDVAERLLGERLDAGIARTCAEMYLARKRKGDPFLALAKLRICCEEDPAHLPTLELLARAFDLAGHSEKATRVRREIGFLAHKAGDGARADAAFSQVPAGRRVNIEEPSKASVPPPPMALVPSSPPRPSTTIPRPSAAPRPPHPSAIRPKAMVPQVPAARTSEESIECVWDELLAEADAKADAPVDARLDDERIDPSRASFWPVDESPADRSGSIVSVSLADVELVEGVAPPSTEPPASLLETALECIDSLAAQGRYHEASALVVRHLVLRPRNSLLIERQVEIEEMLNAHREGPPPALFGFQVQRPDTERGMHLPGIRVVRAS